jgi:hypothetical protein
LAEVAIRQSLPELRLSPATSSKFHPLKEYSLSFTELSKRFYPLNLLHLQQRSLNLVLYVYSNNKIHKLHLFPHFAYIVKFNFHTYSKNLLNIF